MSLEALSSLAAGLCQDVSVTLELTASTWAWAPERRALLVPRDALGTLGIDGCAGIVAHEIGHALLSRYHLFAFARAPSEWPMEPPADEGDALAALGPLSGTLLNALEDPRVELFMGRRYPGAVRWLEVARAAHPHVEAPPIPTMALLLAMVRDGWVLGASRVGALPPSNYPADLPTAVRDALEATRAARARYIHLLPESSLEPPPEALTSYVAETLPLLASDVDPWPPRAPEAWVRRLAGTAALVCRDEIAPEVARLLDADIRTLAHAMAVEPELEGAVRLALSVQAARSRLAPLVFGAFARQAGASAGAPPAERPGAFSSLARRALFAVLAPPPPPSVPMGVPISLAGVSPAGPELAAPARAPGEGPPSDAEARSAYQEDRVAVAVHVDELVRTLEEVLQRRQRLGRRAGYVTGQRIDLRRAMAFVGSPRKPLNLWVRPSMPDRRSAAFLLLVDLSGSMRGPKIEHAMRGAVLFAETLARLQIPMSVWGFQDELVPAIGFGQAFDDDARGRLRSLAHEVSGSRPGGHNRPAFNDDGPCLREAAAHLLDRSEDDRVLVVLSDGHPEGRRSSARDLHHAVSTLAPLLSLVGIGLGPGTEHVSDYYPRALASVSLEALPSALGGVLRQSLALAA